MGQPVLPSARPVPTDANLAARQASYAYQHPHIDLPAAVLDLAA